MRFDREEVRTAADLAAIVAQSGVQLRREGKELIGLCPFVEEKTPSFTVSNNLYKCFGCGAGGDVFQFIGQMEGITKFPEQLQRVAELAGVLPTQNEPAASAAPRRMVASYDYTDESGVVLYQVRRFEPGRYGKKKDFEQYRPDGRGGWIAGLGNGTDKVRQVLYRLPAVIAAEKVAFTEGERDVNTLEGLNWTATTKSGGTNGVTPDGFVDIFKGKAVYIFGDNDAPGRKYSESIAALLAPVAAVHIARIPEQYKDITEYVEAGHSDLEGLFAAPPANEAAADWEGLLLRSQSGAAKPVLANGITALSESAEWRGVLAFNDFAVRVQVNRPTPWGKKAGEAWTDNDDRRTAEWLQRKGILASTNLAGEAVQTVAIANRFHPVRDYLASVAWDGTRRLDRWCETYLGAEKPIANKFGRLWMISAVARIMKPGTKADCCLVLEGPQGKGKSTALHTLAGEWFTDQLADLGSKDAAMQCHGVWIVEIAELDSINRSESSRIKGFMSATFDRIRLPYGKNVTELPRDCVFAGTVNHDNYLRDETGARRFWPIRCVQIDLAGLARDRDQLWAEALAQYNTGAAWWLQDQDSIDQAEAEQSDRYQEGAWDGSVAAWLRSPTARHDAHGHPVAELSSDADSVTVSDILHHCIGKEQKNWTRADQMAVSAVLKSLGWERFRKRDGYKFEWRYRRQTA